MLTIQPNFTHAANTKPLAFRAAETLDADESTLKEKANFYQTKMKEFDETLNDTKAPKTLKTMAKVFKVVSEALFEGWLVAWGATKGSNVVKSAVISGINSKAAARAKNLVTPLGEYFNKAVSFVGENFTKLRNSEKVVKFISDINSKIEILDKSRIGHYVVEGAKTLKKGVSAVAGFVGGLVKKVKNPIKDMNAEQVYDKATKVTSTTLGVGAGIAGAYNSATNAEARKAAQEKEEVQEKFDNIDEGFEEDFVNDSEI
jgi:hypothetical protein